LSTTHIEFADNGVLRALGLALLLLVTAPAAAGASTVSVEPFREPSDIDPFGSCARYMTCPADMLVVVAASGEVNHLAITETFVSFGQNRYVVRDRSAPLVAGPGCEPVAEPAPPPPAAVVCTAGAVGFQRLGDGDDWITSPGGWVTGGDGNDVLTVSFGDADGGKGDDVLLVATGNANGQAGHDTVIGQRGEGGSGDDRLTVASGAGNAGDDELSCFSHRSSGCFLNGGRGDDRLIGGAGLDRLGGGPGADRLQAREDRSAGQRPRKDRVDCGTGRRDRATVDRRDSVKRCERVTRGRAG
jgi:hypothetical protein